MPATNQRDKLPGKTSVIIKDNEKNQNSFNTPIISPLKGCRAIKGILEKLSANSFIYYESTIIPTTVNFVRSGLNWQIFISYEFSTKNRLFSSK